MTGSAFAIRQRLLVPVISLVLIGGPGPGPTACVQALDPASGADTLDGRVMTENGEAAIPGASLRLNLEDHVREVRSDSAGRYVFRDLPAGRHELRVAADGYRSMEIVVHLPERGRFTVDVWLETGRGAASFP